MFGPATASADTQPAGQITQYNQYPVSPASTAGLVAGPDGNLWLAQPSGFTVVSPTGSEVASYPVTGGFGGGQPSVRPDGRIWFDESTAAIAARKRALADWEEANPGVPYDPDWFTREILPALASVKLSEIVGATGMSKAYASEVRRGKWTPHMSTWAALAELASCEESGD